jgi:hypothetical protein
LAPAAAVSALAWVPICTAQADEHYGPGVYDDHHAWHPRTGGMHITRDGCGIIIRGGRSIIPNGSTPTASQEAPRLAASPRGPMGDIASMASESTVPPPVRHANRKAPIGVPMTAHC